MTQLVFDSAEPFTQARLNSVKAAGGIGVCRYVKRWTPNNYDLEPAERTLILGNGLGLEYNAEQAAGDMLNQSPAWWQAYGAYVAARLQSWGVRTDRGITVAASCDQDITTEAQLEHVVANYAAFRAGLAVYGMRAYAQTQVIERLISTGVAAADDKEWLPGARGWSGLSTAVYNAYPHAAIVQQIGTPVAGTDENTVLDLAGLGMEWPEGHYPAGSGAALATTNSSATEDNKMQFRLIQRTPTADSPNVAGVNDGIYAYATGTALWWWVPDEAYIPVLRSHPDCLTQSDADIPQPAVLFDVLRAMADTAAQGPSGISNQILSTLPTVVTAANNATTAANSAVAAAQDAATAAGGGVDQAALEAAAEKGASAGAVSALTGLSGTVTFVKGE